MPRATVAVSTVLGSGRETAILRSSVAAVRETEPWEELLRTGREDDRLVHDDVFPARAARTVSLPEQLDWRVAAALEGAGIERLYEHQRQALLAAFDGPT